MSNYLAVINQIVIEEIEERVKAQLMDKQAIWDAAEARLDEELKNADVSIWPDGKGFVITVHTTDLYCNVEKELELLCNEGRSEFETEMLERIRTSLLGVLEKIDFEIAAKTRPPTEPPP